MNGKHFHIPFIIMTEYAEVHSSVRAMKLGAEDYLPKPFSPEDLYARLTGLLQRKKAAHEKKNMIFSRQSKQVKEVERHVALVAFTEMVVLIRGENGTGKEHIANLVHKLSARRDKPFIAIDCGSIPKELATSEFFGYQKGAFTGATDNKAGLFHEAEGGTLFLDEIGNLPYEVQSSLLRVLQERCYRPVGSRHEIPCDVRIVAATNENLEKAVNKERFRQDLYERFREFEITMPALRNCTEDIMPLAEFFRKRSSEEFWKKVTGFSAEARKKLQTYGWPGNIRELKNCIRKAVLLTERDVVGVDDLDININTENSPTLSLKEENKEKEQILKALDVAQNNKVVAAGLLKISRPTLYAKMEKYGIEIEK